MVRRFGVFLAIATLGVWGEDFITQFEYGQMLYHDPRGASCAACHGETGAGGEIGTYFDRRSGERVVLSAPDIRNASLDRIRRSVREGAGVMPRYFLTEKEIRTLHAYLQRVNRNPAGSIAHLFASGESNRSVKSAE
jgi:mono/diheme cytochrome c family protein